MLIAIAVRSKFQLLAWASGSAVVHPWFPSVVGGTRAGGLLMGSTLIVAVVHGFVHEAILLMFCESLL